MDPLNFETSERKELVMKPARTLKLCINISHETILAKKEPMYYSRGFQTTHDGDDEDEEPFIQPHEESLIEEPVHSQETHVEDVSRPIETFENRDDTNNSKDTTLYFIDDVDKKERLVSGEEFKSFMNRASKIVDRVLFLGERYDLFKDSRDHFERESTHEGTKERKNTLNKVLTIFDEKYTKDFHISCIDWSPFDRDNVIASFYDRDSSHVLEWDLEYEGSMTSRLTHSSRITAVKYWRSLDTSYHSSRGGSRVLVGGSYTGQILLWDARSPRRVPLEVISKITNSAGSTSPHEHPIYSIEMLDSRHFVAIDMGGLLSVWDINNLKHPIEQLGLTWVKGSKLRNTPGSYETFDVKTEPVQGKHDVTVTCCSYKDENAFYVGTEDGVIYQGQRHGDQKGLLKSFAHHKATISSIRVHPTQSLQNALTTHQLSDLVLTSSLDWSVSLWNPRVSKYPLMTLHDFSDYVMDIAWSNFHPSIFSAVDSTGKLALFDINSEEREIPFLTTQEGHALQKVLWSPHEANVLLAGSHSGSIYVYKTDLDRVTPAQDECHKLNATITELLNKTYQEEAKKSFEQGLRQPTL